MKQVYITIMAAIAVIFITGCGDTLSKFNPMGNSSGGSENLIGNRVDYSYKGDAKLVMEEAESYQKLLLGEDFDTAVRVSLHREADISAGNKPDAVITEQEARNVRNKYLDFVGSATDEVTRQRFRDVDPNSVVDRVNKAQDESEIRWNSTE